MMRATDFSPAISIIMPAYNAQAFIAKAIDSVRGQTMADWELLIINDGSTDDTLGAIQAYGDDARIKVISQENQGVSAARNRGLDEAKGVYIAFIDSDDYYEPTYLEKLYNRITQTECDLVYCGTLHEKENKIQGAPYPEMNLLMCYASGLIDYIGLYATMTKRLFLEEHKIRFTIGCTVGEDQEFLMHCGIFAQVKSVPEVLYHYCWNPQSVMSKMTPAKVHVDLESRQRSTRLVQQLYQGPDKRKIIQFLKSWEDRIVIIFTNIVIQRIKKSDMDGAYEEVMQYGRIPACWRQMNIRHIKRSMILNTHNKKLWLSFFGKKK